MTIAAGSMTMDRDHGGVCVQVMGASTAGTSEPTQIGLADRENPVADVAAVPTVNGLPAEADWRGRSDRPVRGPVWNDPLLVVGRQRTPASGSASGAATAIADVAMTSRWAASPSTGEGDAEFTENANTHLRQYRPRACSSHQADLRPRRIVGRRHRRAAHRHHAAPAPGGPSRLTGPPYAGNSPVRTEVPEPGGLVGARGGQ